MLNLASSLASGAGVQPIVTTTWTLDATDAPVKVPSPSPAMTDLPIDAISEEAEVEVENDDDDATPTIARVAPATLMVPALVATPTRNAAPRRVPLPTPVDLHHPQCVAPPHLERFGRDDANSSARCRENALFCAGRWTG